jgi:hypothetical protein
MYRREFVTVAGATGTIALAGCLGDDGDENGGQDDDENTGENAGANGDENTTENGDDGGANGNESTGENGDENTGEDGDDGQEDGGGDGEESGGETNPSAVVETYFGAFDEADPEELDELSHPDLGLDPSNFTFGEGSEITSIDVESLESDVGTGDIEGQNGAVEIAGETFFIDAETVETLVAAEDVAVFEVTLTLDSGGAQMVPVLAATDGGDWYVRDFVFL